MHEDVERVLYSEEQIRTRVAELGLQISRDYRGRSLLLVCVLRGAVVFTADLMRRIDVPVELDCMVASSYGDGTESSGNLDVVSDLEEDVAGRHVLLVDDILDSGLTLDCISALLVSRGAASVAVAALLRKANPRQLQVDCRYVGFECPDEFVVGYGLDYAQRYRNLPYVGVLKPEVYASA